MTESIYTSTQRAKPPNNKLMGIFKRKPSISSPAFALPDSGPPTTDHGCSFLVGVCQDVNNLPGRNNSNNHPMEDAHAYIYNYASMPDAGYFAVFDGHGGSKAAQWCAANLHGVLAAAIHKHDETGRDQAIALATPTTTASSSGSSHTPVPATSSKQPVFKHDLTKIAAPVQRINQRQPPTDQHFDFFMTHKVSLSPFSSPTGTVPLALFSAFTDADKRLAQDLHTSVGCTAAVALLRSETDPTYTQIQQRRVLYTANVGDSRIVLCRGRHAVRLSYDHRAGDPNESARILACGGSITNNRVNGMLAVTRSLGDGYMKSLVSGKPYTTRTVLSQLYESGSSSKEGAKGGNEDKFLILACDGLWDVCSDQGAVDFILQRLDPAHSGFRKYTTELLNQAAKDLVSFGIELGATDNITCMVVAL